MTKQDIISMRNVDLMAINKKDLVDISDIVINKELPPEERVKDYIKQIKNPYCYIDNGIVVKISFTGEKSLEDCLKTVLIPDINF